MERHKPAEKLELKEIETASTKIFRKVSCPSCQKDVEADHLNLQNSIAKCGTCHVIFSIEKEVESVKTKTEMKQQTIRPEGIDLFYFKDDLEITVQQHVQGLDLYGVIFFPILCFFSLLIYFTKGMPVYFPVAFTLGTLYFIYKALNYTNNKTFIDINDKSLSIKSRPKNLKKDKTYSADEIDQLYLKHSADGAGYYTIHMIVNGLEGQKHEKLITVNTLSKAKYLEQEIERYLNIEDRKVPEANV